VSRREPAPVTVFTFFLDLPYALPLSDGHSTVSAGERDEHWQSWSDADVAETFGALPGADLPLGSVPSIGAVVRHGHVIDLLPQVLAEEVFAEWYDDLMPDSAEERRADREARGNSGIQVVKSVVALSRFVPRSAHPPGREMAVGWLYSQFQLSLKDFNEFLDALGFVTERWDVGPVALRDLPARIPVLIASTNLLPDGPSAVTLSMQIHDALPVLSGNFEVEQEHAEEAIELNKQANNREQPYMLVFRFLHAAQSEWLAGDSTRAVIDLNTAVEVLITTTLYAGGELLGMAGEDLKRANQAGVKNRVRKSLAMLLDKEIDIDDPENPWGRWFGDGYLLRNQAVHEGASLDEDDVDRAFAQAAAVVQALKEDLDAVEPLKLLGRLLELEMSTDPPPFNEEPLGIAFPWDQPLASRTG
jgi:hypothetical protein